VARLGAARLARKEIRMRSTFGGLNTANLALIAQQLAVDTTSHNIANANTPGFSRQSVQLETTSPLFVPTINRSPTAGQLGTGVQAATIERLRDTFIDGQLRQQSGGLGEQRAMRDVMEQIEVVLNEPSDSNVNATMSRFFNAWQAVTNRPDDLAVRSMVTVEATALADTIKRNREQLGQIGTDLNQRVGLNVERVNSLAEQVARLNDQIAQVRGSGQQPNDLSDQRDMLIDQLGELVQVSLAENPNGAVNLFINSRALVIGGDAMALTTDLNAAGDTIVEWAGDGAPVGLGSGTIQGLITVRDGLLKDQIAGLDDLAAAFIAEVNAIHVTGYGLTDTVAPNRAFFSGGDAATIGVNNDILADPGAIAAAARPGEPGDNRKALAIIGVQNRMTMSGATATFQTFFQANVAALGAATRKATTATENQQALVTMLARRKEAVAGVNLDEEAMNLIKYQHAYQAAARVVTTIDEMLDRIINGMGRVGL
jgi:flagellar hook-associated protein 1